MLTTLIIIAAVLIIVVAILFGASLFFYNVGILRSKKEFLVDDPNLVKTEFPWDSATSWMGLQPIETLHMISDDGLKLVGYFIPSPQPSNKIAILAHGYSSQGREMGEFAKLYQGMGYHVLMPDDRGHGQSEGKYIGFGWPDRKDYIQWIHEMIHRVGKDAEVILHGVSMGGATVLMVSGEPLPTQVKAIVSDCAYTSAKDILSYQLKSMYKLPAFPLIYMTSLVAKLRAGYWFGEASAIKQVSQTTLPILFVHGDEDKFVPFEMVHQLYEVAGGEKDLLIVEHAQHGNAYYVNKEVYGGKLVEFFNRYVSSKEGTVA
ncbi:fermentation-respiration switch protein FrsA (DUF1100 family) [Paenibacillus sp. DS2015]|uniref:alpha/beta hydrolase n=1 Tax=Paenibacillus sp. DS2015 TaxID=3373917 RepID=UPI003D191C61